MTVGIGKPRSAWYIVGFPDLTYILNLLVNVALVINVHLLMPIYKVTMWTEVKLIVVKQTLHIV